MSQEKLDTVRRHFIALNAWDVDGFLECCTEDVELVPATWTIDGTTYRGRAGIERFFADLRETTGDFEVKSERLQAVGEKVLSFDRGSARGRASDVGGDFPVTSVYDFRSTKISRIQVFVDRAEALKAAGLPG